MAESKRVRVAQQSFQAAARGVRKNIQPEILLQLFPEREESAEYLTSIARTAHDLLEQEFERAWNRLSTQGTFAKFSDRAAELDALESVASSRLHAGHAATFTYARSADPELSVAALTAPQLRDEISEMRSKRRNLEQKTELSAQETVARAQKAAQLEQDLRHRLAIIAEVDDALARTNRSALARDLLERSEEP